ncbi:MAG TPA: hypothetical protein VJO15_06900 [Dehalococcoidia bacterium]|nr:hypothetical protein [Dehalococcoidia bacterium]
MLRHTTLGSNLSYFGTPAPGAVRRQHHLYLELAVGLVLVSSVLGAGLFLRVATGAQADLFFAKWAYVMAVSAVLGSSLWGVFAAGHRRLEHMAAAPGLLRTQYAALSAMQKYATAAVLASGTYLLVGYSLSFGETYGPWYSGLVGVQGLLWMGLVSVVGVGELVLAETGTAAQRLVQQWLKLTVVLCLASLAATAALDVDPYRGLDVQAMVIQWVQLAAFSVWFGAVVWNLFQAIPASVSRIDRFQSLARLALPVALVAGLFQAYALMS